MPGRGGRRRYRESTSKKTYEITLGGGNLIWPADTRVQSDWGSLRLPSSHHQPVDRRA